MQSKIILLIVPPIVALALLWFSKQQELGNIETTALPKQSTVSSETDQNSSQSNIPNSTKTVTTSQPAVSNTEALPPSAEQSPMSAIAQIRAIKNKTALHQAILTEHEQFTRYPSQNTRIENSSRDPVVMSYETHERSSASDDESSIITVWTDQKYILNGDNIKIYARVDDANQRGVANKLLGQLIFNESNIIGAYEFSDPNADGTYEMTIDSIATQTLSPGIYKVIIVSSIKELSESVSFILSPPLISLTGEVRDRVITPGHLEMSIEVSIAEPGRYYARASLYSANGDPIGSAEYGDELSVGTHWLPLKYFGRLFHDAGEPGPYTLKHIELAKAGVPMFRMPAQTSNYLTPSYPLETFNPQTFSEENSLQ